MIILDLIKYYKALPEKKKLLSESELNDIKLDINLLETHIPGISRHINLQTDPESELLRGLKIIQYYCFSPNNKDAGTQFFENTKASILDKLQDGAKNCTKGINERVDNVLTSLHRLGSIDEYIERQRISNADIQSHLQAYVINTNTNHAFEVHTQAYLMQQFSSENQPNQVIPSPLFILTQIPNEMASELRNYYNYKGNVSPGSYQLGAYQSIYDYFKILLQFDLSKNIWDIFITEDKGDWDTAITDVNWIEIQRLLFNWLKDNEYLIFENNENDLDLLFFNDLFSDSFDISKPGYAAIIDRLNLIKYPEFVNRLPFNTKRAIVFDWIPRMTESQLNDYLSFMAEGDKLEMIDKWLAIPDNQNKIFSDLKQSTKSNKAFDLLQKASPAYLQSLLPQLLLISRNLLDLNNPSSLINQRINSNLYTFTSNLVKILVSILQALPISQKDEKKCIVQTITKILIMAIRSDPYITGEILRLIRALENEVQLDVLFGSSPYLISADESDDELRASLEKPWQRNLLILAAESNDVDAMRHLLILANSSLTPQQQAVLFQEFDKHVLMIALANQSPLSLSLLEVIKSFDKQAKLKIFTQQNKSDCHVLAIAITHQPQLVQPLLEQINLFDDESKFKLFNQKDSAGRYVLTLAAKHQPDKMPVLLDAVKKMERSARAQTLVNAYKREKNTDIAHALDELSQELAEEINNLPEDNRIIQVIKGHLLTMQTDESFYKKSKVLSALKKLELSSELLAENVMNPESELYQALNIKRSLEICLPLGLRIEYNFFYKQGIMHTNTLNQCQIIAQEFKKCKPH